MKKILFAMAVLACTFTNAQSPFNVSGACTLANSYSSGQYHYSRAVHDTVAADGHQLLVLDDSTTTTSVSLTLPALTVSPYPGQLFTVVSMDSMATVSMHAGVTIQGTSLTTLPANKKASWVYVYSARSKGYVWLRTE